MKCVIIIDHNLPLGLLANTAAVLAMTIGDRIRGVVGEDVIDKDGQLHRGITQVNIPLLKGDGNLIRNTLEKLLKMGNDDLFHVDFCDTARKSRHYDEYKAQLKKTPSENLTYLGLAIYGPSRQINKLTGNIGLLR